MEGSGHQNRQHSFERIAEQRQGKPGASENAAGVAGPDTAASLFAENGYDRTGMVAIAEAVGISAPALYYHFASKEEILYCHLEQAMTEITTALRDAVENAGPGHADRLAAGLVAPPVESNSTPGCEQGNIGSEPRDETNHLPPLRDRARTPAGHGRAQANDGCSGVQTFGNHYRSYH